MDKLTNKIISQIQAKEIKPIPRRTFLIRNIGLWLLSVLSVGLGSLSISLVAYNVTNQDWDIYRHLDESMFGFFISSLPYLWITLVIISLTIAILNFEHSKNGYKYSPFKITLVSILLSLILGFGSYALGFGEKIDNYFGSKFTNYQSIEAEKKLVWNQPEKGLFSGTIETTDQNKKTFTLKDLEGKRWNVVYADATVRSRANLETDSKVKIIGEQYGDTIVASDIRPWENTGRGQGFGNPAGKGRNRNNSN